VKEFARPCLHCDEGWYGVKIFNREEALREELKALKKKE
jgi:hypothetical protein